MPFLSTPPPPTCLYTLSLHDALPIFPSTSTRSFFGYASRTVPSFPRSLPEITFTLSPFFTCMLDAPPRSEKHTSELQSRGHLVCRLLLEKKNKTYQD